MINVLIRTSYRPVLFHRLLSHLKAQTYKDLRIIVSYDNDRALEYIPEELEKIKVHKDTSRIHYYDDYCNVLKALVTDGWFWFVDDDDKLCGDPTLLEQIVNQLTPDTPGLICQFSRAGKLKPSDELIERGIIRLDKIGMPCLFLHHSHKNLVDLDGSAYGADYFWIQQISQKVKLKFVAIPVVYADRRSRGAMS